MNVAAARLHLAIASRPGNLDREIDSAD